MNMIQNVSELELKRAISSEDINFLAFPVTPWAAHGVEAFIYSKKKENVRLKGYVCIVEHGKAGYLLDEKHFMLKNSEIQIVKFVASKDENILKKIERKIELWKFLCQNQKGSDEIYILNQGTPNYEWHSIAKKLKPNCNVHSVIIDEGIGMYMREKKEWLNENLLMATGLKNKCSAFLMLVVKQPLMEAIVKKKREVESFCLFEKSFGRLQENKSVILSYKNIICQDSQAISNEHRKLYDNAIVINTQPFIEYNQVTMDEDLKWIKIICDTCKRNNVKVVLKPHPREKKIDRYSKIDNCWIDVNNEISQESIMSQLNRKPFLLIGFSSTTLITEKLFEGITAVSLTKCVNYNNFAESILGDFKAFARTFSDGVILPNNEEELITIIKKEIGRSMEGEE